MGTNIYNNVRAQTCNCAFKVQSFPCIIDIGAMKVTNAGGLGYAGACSGVINELLGSPTQYKRCELLPREIEFVSMAFSCQQGPLSNYIVVSRLHENQTNQTISPQPALLSLLPRSSNIWVESILDGCSQSPLVEACLAQTSNTTSYSDLRAATAKGCTAFLSLGIAVNSATTIAIVLGFRRQEDCGPSAIKVAKTLMETAATNYSNLIEDFLEMATLLVAPLPLHLSPDADIDEDEEEDLLISDDQENILHSAQSRLLYNNFTLEFKDTAIEAIFAAEHDAASVNLDLFGYLWGFAAMSWALFWPNTRYNQPGLADGVQIWRFFICYLPVFLIFSRRTLPLYIRHREPILVYTLLCTMAWHRYMEHYVNILSTEEFLRPLYIRGYIWLAVIISLFQVRIKLLIPLSMACFIGVASLVPRICSRFYADWSPAVCITAESLWVGALSWVAPVLLVWWAERRARENFMRRIHQD